MRLHYFVYIFSILIITNSCDDNCEGIENALVYEVDGPTQGIVNQSIDLTISFSAKNGCGSYYGMSDNKNANNIEVQVKLKYSGCLCTDALVGFEKEYYFLASKPGTYTIVFKNDYLDDISHTIIIQ